MSLLLKQQVWSAKTQLRSMLVARNTIYLGAACVSSTAKAPPQHYDIIIGGGGLVGTTLAAALATKKALADKRILLLEGAPPFKGFDAPTAPFGNRVSAINSSSVSLFKSIGAWERMTATGRVKPVKQMQVWDGSSDALIQFQHEHFAADVACIVENDLMLDAVYAQIRETAPNVEVRNRTRIEWVRLPEVETGSSSLTNCEVGVQGGGDGNGDTYTCDLLVGADGANSLVRQQMGVDVFSIDYKRSGLVATLELSSEHGGGDNSVAWQRFIPTGPVALLPLSDNMSTLVWSTDVAHAKHLAALPAQQFVDALNEAFCREYPKSEVVVKALSTLNSFMGGGGAATLRQYPPRVSAVVEGSRATFPLGFLHAASYVCSAAALIGDAAHRIHPLAGQGVNLGFSDVQFLVDTIAEAAYAGAKLGDKQHLIKYEQRCLAKNVPMLIGVHALQTLYATTFSPVVLLRSLGLQLTHNIPQIKNMFMKRAMG